MTKLLIIDDDIALCSMLVELLVADRFEVDTAHTATLGVAHARESEYDLVVLDVMLPDGNGLEVLRELRSSSNVPIIMLTARGDDVDRIVGLELGADDYLSKPFNSRELIARIQAVLRRAAPTVRRPSPAIPQRYFKVEDLELDLGERSVKVADTAISLTTIEFDLLAMLVQDAGTPVERTEISHRVFDRAFEVFDRSIDVHVSTIRRKIGKRHDGSQRIRTIRGVGYLYVSPSIKRASA